MTGIEEWRASFLKRLEATMGTLRTVLALDPDAVGSAEMQVVGRMMEVWGAELKRRMPEVMEVDVPLFETLIAKMESDAEEMKMLAEMSGVDLTPKAQA